MTAPGLIANRDRAEDMRAGVGLATALTNLGLMAPFFERSAPDIDRIIGACVDGVQEEPQSMMSVKYKETSTGGLAVNLPEY